jgi:hypothetical protein
MDDRSLIDLLEELAEEFGVKIRYEAIRQDEDAVHVAGGLCVLKGEYVVIVNSRTPVKERIHTLATALKHFDLDQVYLRPALREFLDKIPDPPPFTQDKDAIP